MKPTKNNYYCQKCKRAKIRFETLQEAILFLKYNAAEIEQQTGKRPIRAYYCESCRCWHVTSKPVTFTLQHFRHKFGDEKGSELFDVLSDILGYNSGLEYMLSKKIKELRHALKFTTIKIEKCRSLILSLINVFEIIVKENLLDKVSFDTQLKKFNEQCSIFQLKTQALTC